MVDVIISVGAEVLRGIGNAKTANSRRYAKHGSKPGYNHTSGNPTTNRYADGVRGVDSRISVRPKWGFDQLPGFYRTVGKGISSCEEQISDPGECYRFFADVVQVIPQIIYVAGLLKNSQDKSLAIEPMHSLESKDFSTSQNFISLSVQSSLKKNEFSCCDELDNNNMQIVSSTSAA